MAHFEKLLFFVSEVTFTLRNKTFFVVKIGYSEQLKKS